MANYILNRTAEQISDILDGAYSANGILKSNGSGNITAQAVDSTPTASSTNLITSGAVASALSGKQNTLSNASLLSTYTQTEANLASAVSLKHSHSNKSVLDGISSSDVSSWDAKAEKSVAVSVTIAVADWANNTCTKSVSGVTSSNNIIVSPDPTSFFTYGDAQIRATAQGSGTVTFTCEAVPSESVTVIVLIVG